MGLPQRHYVRRCMIIVNPEDSAFVGETPREMRKPNQAVTLGEL